MFQSEVFLRLKIPTNCVLWLLTALYESNNSQRLSHTTVNLLFRTNELVIDAVRPHKGKVKDTANYEMLHGCYLS